MNQSLKNAVKGIFGLFRAGKAEKKAKKDNAVSEAERLDRIRNPDKYLDRNPAGW